MASVVRDAAPAQAQDALSVGQEITLEGQDTNTTPAGSIISQRAGGFQYSLEAYDKAMIGVLTREAAISFVPQGSTSSATLVKTGTALVRVNGQNGDIAEGDRVTSSDTPGVGMRADQSGFILGTALAPVSLPTTESEATVPVLLDIKFSFAEDAPESARINRRLLDIVSLSSIAAVEQPTVVLRYVVAALTLLGSIMFGFFTFGRIAHKGIEAIGRNPLASKTISFGMLLNVVITLAIIMTGTVIAYLIVTF